MPRLFVKRSLYMPTGYGWLALLILAVAPVALWLTYGESFLAVTARVPADVLILEAWTQEDGAHAAAAEFANPTCSYRWIVLTGGYTGERWTERRWSQVEIARDALLRLGVPPSVIIAATPVDPERDRTLAFAVAAQRAIVDHHLSPTGINVLTRGPHGRRSRITFSEVFGPDMPVGVVSWQPPGMQSEPWWRSSVRADELLKETVAYFVTAVSAPLRR